MTEFETDRIYRILQSEDGRYLMEFLKNRMMTHAAGITESAYVKGMGMLIADVYDKEEEFKIKNSQVTY